MSFAASNARWQLWSHRLAVFRHVEAVSLAGGGPRAIERQVKLNKLTVRNRIKLLTDPGTKFLEFSVCAGYDLPEIGTVPAGGVVTGIGRVGSHDCVIIAQDSTVKAGATYPISLKKALRAAKIAISNHLPIVSLVDSAGAFLPLQSEIFPDENHGGRSFYYQARHRAPQVAVVLGHCTAGGAYTPMMTDQVVIVERQGAVFLGGPPLVKAALGTVVSTEELGGAKVHTSISGCTDYRTSNEVEAMKLTREIFVKAINKPCIVSSPAFDEPSGNLSDIDSIAQRDSVAFDAIKFLSGLFDGSQFHEYKPEWGLAVKTAFGSIQSYPLAAAITTGVTPLISDPDSLAKLAHFIQICSSRDIPFLFVMNASPQYDDEGKYHCNSVALSAAARLMSVISTCPIPRINLIIGDNRANDVFFSPGLQPDFILSWPTARHYPNFEKVSLEEINELSEAEDHINERKALFCDAVYGSARLWDDGIVLPSDTRNVLGRLLAILSTRKARENAYSQIFWRQPPLRHFANIV